MWQNPEPHIHGELTLLSFIVEKIANNRNPGSVSSRLRKKRFSRFLSEFNIDNQTTILDVGGTSHTWAGTGLEKNVTLLNIEAANPQNAHQNFNYVKGSALNMHMFDDKSFDVVFSNSVIEHMGCLENQQKFAEEVQRVGKGYWIQTPHKYFPIEPHLLFPLFQYFPLTLKKQVAVRWKYSHYKMWDKSEKHILREVMNIRLLNRRELSLVFGNARIYEEKLLGLTKSIIAYEKRPANVQSVARRRRAVKMA